MLDVKTVLILVVFFAGLFPASVYTQSSQEDVADKDLLAAPNTHFQRAWHSETADDGLEQALGLYTRLGALEQLPKALRAKAKFRAAMCLRKLQRDAEANDLLEVIRKDFSDVTEVVKVAERELEGESTADAIVREKATALLVDLWTASEERVGDEPSPFAVSYRSLRGIGPAAAPYMIEAMTSRNPHPRSDNLAGILVELSTKDKTVEEEVLRLVKEGAPHVRGHFLSRLPHGDRWWFAILKNLHHEDARVRGPAVTALQLYQSEATFNEVAAMLRDGNAEVRRRAAETIGRISRHKPVTLEKMLSTLRAGYRDAAAEVQRACVDAVGRSIEVYESSVDFDAELRLLEDASPDVAAEVVRLLLSAEVELPREASGTLVRRYDEVVESLTSRRSSDLSALLLLVRSPSAAIVPVLEKAIAAPSDESQRIAISALREIGDTAHAPVLLPLLKKAATKTSLSHSGRQAKIRNRISYSKSDPAVMAWDTLTGRLWGREAIDALSAALPELVDFQEIAAKRLLNSGDAGVVQKVFDVYPRVDATTRAVILQHSILARRPKLAQDLYRHATLDPSEKVRGYALAKLEGGDGLQEVLLSCYDDSLKNAHFEAAAKALERLSELETPESLQVFVEALNHPNETVAGRAMISFPKKLSNAATVATLAERLARPEIRRPELTLEVLRKVAQPSDAPVLAGALDGVAEDLRESLVRLLGKLGNPRVLPALVEQLKQGALDTRRAALVAVVEVDAENAAPRLAELLHDSDLRWAAVGGLEHVSVEKLSDIPGLSDALRAVATSEDATGTARGAAILQLQRLGETAVLESFLTEDEADVRKEAALALGRLRHRGSGPALLEALQNETKDNVRPALLNALARVGDPAALPALMRWSSRGDALGKRLRRDLPSFDPEARVAAARKLIEEGVDFILHAELLRILVEADRDAALVDVRRALDHGSPEVRLAAVARSATLLDRSLLPSLLERLRDDSSAVREAAREAIDAIRFFENERSEIGRASPEDKALEELVKLLKSDVPAVRLAAVKALVSTGAQSALSELVRIRKDPDAEVRAAVQAALDALTDSATEQ